MAGPLADMYSRKYSISGWCIVFMMGVGIQTGANMHVACIYGTWVCSALFLTLSWSLVRRYGCRCPVYGEFRLVTCLASVADAIQLVPMFNAELAAPGIRGSLVALQQLAITCEFSRSASGGGRKNISPQRHPTAPLDAPHPMGSELTPTQLES